MDREDVLHTRPMGPGGWRRALVGFALGAGIGVVVAAMTPRELHRRPRVDPGGSDESGAADPEG